MRIIAGKYKSRKVYTLSSQKGRSSKNHSLKSRSREADSNGFRPTTDRAKETLFNVLNNIIDFDAIDCLDLFAGSGSLGFEAISRGAKECDFVEVSQKQAQLIKQTAAGLGCEGNIVVYREDALKFLMLNEGMLNEGAGYDLIFADPPYDYEHYEELVTGVLKLKFSIFVLEYGLKDSFMYNLNDYEVIEKKTGTTNFKIFVTKN